MFISATFFTLGLQTKLKSSKISCSILVFSKEFSGIRRCLLDFRRHSCRVNKENHFLECWLDWHGWKCDFYFWKQFHIFSEQVYMLSLEALNLKLCLEVRYPRLRCPTKNGKLSFLVLICWTFSLLPVLFLSQLFSCCVQQAGSSYLLHMSVQYTS